MLKNRIFKVKLPLTVISEQVFNTALFIFPDLNVGERLEIRGGVALNEETSPDLADPRNANVNMVVSLDSTALLDVILGKKSAALLYISGDIKVLKGSILEFGSFMGNFVASTGTHFIFFSTNFTRVAKLI